MSQLSCGVDVIPNVPDGTLCADRGNIIAGNCGVRRRDEGVAVEPREN